MPRLTDALLDRGTICLVALPMVWSMPTKKLNPDGWKFTIHPNPTPKLPAAMFMPPSYHFTGAMLAENLKSVHENAP